MKHPSLDGLKPYHEYIEHLQEIYPNVPYETIKKVEKTQKDENKMNEELYKLNFRLQIGKRITELRAEKKLSLQDLSEISGITKANISRIENGKYNVGIDVLSKLSDALDAQVEIVQSLHNKGKQSLNT